jgi:hypothetical protein
VRHHWQPVLDSKNFKDLVTKKGTIKYSDTEGLGADGMYVNASGETIKLCTFDFTEMDYLKKAHYIRDDSRGIYRLTDNAYAAFGT